MPKQNFNERRQAIRAQRILSIQYRLVKSKLKKDQDTNWHIATTHDMSASGLSFIADLAYHVGDILELHMVMSGVIDIYKGHGQVVRIEERRTGLIYLIAVKFVDEKLFKKKS